MSAAPFGHSVPGTPCDGCGATLDATVNASDPSITPREGDVSICFYCRRVAVYRADQTLRRMTLPEWGKLNEETRRYFARVGARI